MNMVFSPRRSNRIAPINNVIIPPIKIPENTERSIDTPLIHCNTSFAKQNLVLNGDFVEVLNLHKILQNDNTIEPRSPSSTRSAPIFRTSSMQSLYNGYPKFTMFNLAPSSDCSSCGGKK